MSEVAQGIEYNRVLQSSGTPNASWCDLQPEVRAILQGIAEPLWRRGVMTMLAAARHGGLHTLGLCWGNALRAELVLWPNGTISVATQDQQTDFPPEIEDRIPKIIQHIEDAIPGLKESEEGQE